MIELLILYTVHKRDKTIYTIRKDIIDTFGTFTIPSIGTIYPALQRLLKEDALILTERISAGGRKSSYFGISKNGLKVFKNYFFNSLSENPSLFHTQFLARLGTMSMLNAEEKKQFVEEYTKKLDLFVYEIKNRLNDEFADFDYFQKEMLNMTINESENLKSYLNKLKV